LNITKKETGFPITEENGKQKYDIVEVLLYICANDGLLKTDFCGGYRVPSLQKKTDTVEQESANLKAEQAALTHYKKEREKIRLAMDKKELVKSKVRDAEEAERYSIIRGRIYEICRTGGPELLKSTTIEQASEIMENLVDTSFRKIMDDFNNINNAEIIEESKENTEDDNEN
jgi:hypothetical protein